MCWASVAWHLKPSPVCSQTTSVVYLSPHSCSPCFNHIHCSPFLSPPGRFWTHGDSSWEGRAADLGGLGQAIEKLTLHHNQNNEDELEQ